MSPSLSHFLASSPHPLDSPAFAKELDALPLNPATGLTGRETREMYEVPRRGVMGAEGDGDSPCIYMAGNSLGLLPKEARRLVQEEMDVWGERAVLGHFSHPHSRPWKSIDDNVVPQLANLVGAQDETEVACTSTLTSNLHNLFVTFFRPEAEGMAKEGASKRRYKILCEGKAFPSDQYAIQSHLDLHGLPPSALIELEPREGEDVLRTEDILDVLEREGEEIALVWLSGVQYYTGQVFEMERIASKAREMGCLIGLDLAHAIGNVPLSLHDWEIDFAVWCHYKYLNSGPGAVAGMFVHARHAHLAPKPSCTWTDPDANPSGEAWRPRLAGWWGHSRSTRFAMPGTFEPIEGAQGWQHSNPPVLSMLPLIASLRTVERAGGMGALRARSVLLTGYLIELLRGSRYWAKGFRVLGWEEGLRGGEGVGRGAQVSLAFGGGEKGRMKRVFEALVSKGVMGDEREPEVIRFAPIPLYSTFEDVRLVALYLDEVLEEEEARSNGEGTSSSGEGGRAQEVADGAVATS